MFSEKNTHFMFDFNKFQFIWLINIIKVGINKPAINISLC